MRPLVPLLRIALAASSLLAHAAHAVVPQTPAPDPPAATGAPGAAPPRRRAEPLGQIEWTLHKTADGAHPDGAEQLFVWLMNRARRDPAAEGAFLATVDDPGVQSALGYFGVDVGVLQDEFDAIVPKPPAAFDVRLYEAAYQHSLYLIANDAQSHTDQFTRVANAGFHFASIRGNVFSYADSALYGHAGFNVDWGGNDGTGMQAGRGHRKAIMSLDGDYTNVGLAAVPESNPSTQVGPLVVTGNYASAATSYADHFDRFVVGTVWEDANGNGRYDEDEGFAGVAVVPDAGPYFAVTAAGGGFAIPIPAPGPYVLTFSGGGVPTRSRGAVVGADSVLVDYVVPEPGAAAAGALALLVLAILRSRRIEA